MSAQASAWWEDAPCRGKQKLFFPIASGGSHHARPSDPYAAARKICAGCPFRGPCLDDALAMARAGHQVDGCWAGLDEHERRAMLGRRRTARAS